MCLITRGDSTVDVIAMGRRGDEDMQIFRHGEFVTHGSSGGLMTSQFTRERQTTLEGESGGESGSPRFRNLRLLSSSLSRRVGVGYGPTISIPLIIYKQLWIWH